MATAFCIAILVFCAYQDLRYRGIHWLAFPVLFGASIWLCEGEVGLDLLWNMLLLLGLMVLLSAYVALKEGKWTWITQGFFSWGDVLFLLAMTPLFHPLSYAAFITLACFFSLLAHLVASMLKPQKTIPFAGYAALISIWVVTDSHFMYRITHFYEF
jgi:hypothetical protein